MAMSAAAASRPVRAPDQSRLCARLTVVKRPHRARGAARGVGALAAAVAIALTVGLAYVALTAGDTAQTYRLSAGTARHSQLLVDARAARDRVAALQSLERLENVAAHLKMTAPAKVAIIATPPTVSAASRGSEGPLAVVTHWLGIR